MKATRFWTIAATAVLAAQSAAAATVTLSHFEELQSLQLRNAAFSGDQKPGLNTPAVLSFDALGRTFELELQPNASLLSTAQLPPDFSIYRGAISGNPDSWARITIHDGVPSGVIFDGSELIALEASGAGLAATSSPIVYRLADAHVATGTMSCGSHELSGSGDEVFQKLVGEVQYSAATGPGAVSEISIGAVGDFEFTSSQGGDAAAAAAILNRLNIVDGIYSQAIGVQIIVPFIETFSDANDPFSNETDSGLFLSEVATYRQGSTEQRQHGLTHLYTGRDLDGSTVGIAYNDVLCRNNAGAGLSMGNDQPTSTFDALVAAHEIGHNFGAPHDGVEGACEAEPMDFIMAPTISSSMEFSQCSINIMSASAAAASCVVALPTVDMMPSISPLSGSYLLSQSVDFSIDVRNRGGSAAANTTVDITLPANLSFNAASVDSGNCTSGAGNVNCTLGAVEGLSVRTITLEATANGVGTGNLDVTVSADSDERVDNDTASLAITVLPAVDLTLSNSSGSTIDLDQPTSITATLQNLSTLSATDVALTATVGGGIRIDSVNWTAGSCTVADRQVDCTAAAIAGGSSSTFTINGAGYRPRIDIARSQRRLCRDRCRYQQQQRVALDISTRPGQSGRRRRWWFGQPAGAVDRLRNLACRRAAAQRQASESKLLVAKRQHRVGLCHPVNMAGHGSPREHHGKDTCHHQDRQW